MRLTWSFITILLLSDFAFAEQAHNLSINSTSVVTVDDAMSAQSLGPGTAAFQICNIFSNGGFVPEYWVSVPTAQLQAAQNKGASIPNPREKLAKNLYKEARQPFLTAGGEISVLVKAYDVFDPTDVEQALNNMGLNVLGTWGRNSWQVLLKEPDIQTLQNRHWVEHLEAGPFRPKPQGRAGREATGAEVIQGYNDSNGTYELSGKLAAEDWINVAIADGGIRPHDDLRIINDEDRRYACLCETFTYADDPLNPEDKGCKSEGQLCGWSSHAQRMAGIALGDGDTLAAIPLINNRGQAPQAKYGDYPPFAGEEDVYAHVVDNEAHLVIQPHNTEGTTTYGVDAASVDNFIAGAFGYERMPQIWPAGNCFENLLGVDEPDPLNQLKNAIVTTVFPFASCTGNATRGPTADGRTKPDLVVDISAQEHFPSYGESWKYTYAYMQSSESTAAVGGLTALLLEKAIETTAIENFDFPSTTKALLINTAKDVGAAGPDHISGFGAVDGEAARDVLDKEAASPGKHIIEDRITNSLFPHRYCFTEDAEPGDFRATLAWDDRGSCLTTAFRFPSLFNDLDIWLRKDGAAYALPLVADPNPIVAASPSRDRLNNAERIEVELLPEDIEETALLVRSARIFMIEGQDYSIVSSHPIERCDSAFPLEGGPQLYISDQPIPVDDICAELDLCEPCPGGPLGTEPVLCPAFDLPLSQLSEADVIEVIDPTGKALSMANYRATILRVPERRGGRPVFLRSNRPIDSPVTIKLRETK